MSSINCGWSALTALRSFWSIAGLKSTLTLLSPLKELIPRIALIVTVHDGVHQQFANCRLGIVEDRLLPERRHGHRPFPCNGRLDEKVNLRQHPDDWPLERMLVQDWRGIVQAIEIDILHIRTRKEVARIPAEQKNGRESNVVKFRALRSANIVSSAGVAMSRRGPIRIHVRPRYLTGG
jgi:hypothetical protein